MGEVGRDRPKELLRGVDNRDKDYERTAMDECVVRFGFVPPFGIKRESKRASSK